MAQNKNINENKMLKSLLFCKIEEQVKQNCRSFKNLKCSSFNNKYEIKFPQK